MHWQQGSMRCIRKVDWLSQQGSLDLSPTAFSLSGFQIGVLLQGSAENGCSVSDPRVSHSL